MRVPFSFLVVFIDDVPVRRRITGIGLKLIQAGIFLGFLLQRFSWDGVLITKNKKKI
jgi:hypothetical protein